MDTISSKKLHSSVKISDIYQLAPTLQMSKNVAQRMERHVMKACLDGAGTDSFATYFAEENGSLMAIIQMIIHIMMTILRQMIIHITTTMLRQMIIHMMTTMIIHMMTTTIIHMMTTTIIHMMTTMIIHMMTTTVIPRLPLAQLL